MSHSPARLASLLLLVAAPSFAYELKRDSTGEPVRWQRAVEFLVDEGLGEALAEPGALGAVQTAFASLRERSGVPLTVREGETSGVGYDFTGGENQSEIVALDDWEYDGNAIAVTIVTVDSKSHAIIDADIAFNTASRDFRVLEGSSNGNGQGRFDDIQNTLTHELGHAVGLGHEPDEPAAVMFPSARRGEVSKRQLSDDDVSGLHLLYGTAAAPAVSPTSPDEEPTAGCSATGASGLLPLALAALGATLRRRKVAVAAAALLSTASLASGRAEAPVADAAAAARAEVVSRRTLAPAAGAKLLRTEVRLKTTECLKGACPEEWVIVVPGGRLGELEQTVEGLSVPEVGEKVAFTVAPGEVTMRPSPSRVRLYRMQHAPDMVAFFQGLVRAQVPTESRATQR